MVQNHTKNKSTFKNHSKMLNMKDTTKGYTAESKILTSFMPLEIS